MSKHRVALVGCGRISGTHFKAIDSLSSDLTLVSVCDIVEERAQTASQQTGATPYTDLAIMLEKEQPDLLTICTPSGLHPEMGILAAQHGIHVVTEKPMGVELAAADSLIRECEQQNVHLMVVKQNRLNTTSQLLKRAIDNGRFGTIYMAQANVFWRRTQDYYDADAWRGTWALDGGAFLNQACHYIDLLCWLLGDVQSVTAMTDHLARNIEAEDTGSAIVRFKSGAIVSVNVTMLAYPSDLEGSVTILGEHGTVELGGVALNSFERWDFATNTPDDQEIEQLNYDTSSVYGFGHLPYYKHVVDVLNGKAKPDPDGYGARKSLEVILAIYESSRSGKRINLPL